ncbi:MULTISPECIES: agmatinase [Streptomyces]|uniref:Agmatinase n=2 Tax=Streptomyces TaxID=1883 RepID=A0A6G3SKL5_STRAQ|nr:MULTISPECIES: agmatinase [Streptomyces]NDZ59869.1 agmatinase [Streptomyces anulatus]NEB83556.1 agmatinase [Streptomyces anulatus]NEB98119.1 agmatinase [Streptomyces anulatus]NED24730.1 agmatinase [Streptomyces anulatus]OLO29398.1 agmatinase [Streptomyces sp. MNU77]
MNPFAEPDVPIAAFAGIPTYARLPHSRDLTGVDVAVVGVPFDGTVTYRSGGRLGPRAVRTASGIVGGYNPAQAVAPFKELRCVDYGDVPVVPGNTERSHAAIERTVRRVLDAGATPLLFGGDHSCTLAHLRAFREAGPVAVIDLDAHTDCADEYFGERYSHGSWLRRAIEEGLVDPSVSIQIGLRGSVDGPETYASARDELGLEYVTTDDVRGRIAETAALVRERVGDRPVFLSLDLDVVDPAFAPGTGTPEPGGLMSYETISLLRQLGPLDFVGFDIMELVPAYDAGEITAVLAGNLGFELLCLLARRRRAASDGAAGAVASVAVPGPAL